MNKYIRETQLKSSKLNIVKERQSNELNRKKEEQRDLETDKNSKTNEINGLKQNIENKDEKIKELSDDFEKKKNIDSLKSEQLKNFKHEIDVCQKRKDDYYNELNILLKSKSHFKWVCGS